MKNKNIAIILTAILICLASTTIISAQIDESKKTEVSAEYSYTHAPDLLFFSPQKLAQIPNANNGWSTGAAHKLKKWVAVYVEVGQERGKMGDNYFTSTSNRTSILGGIRFYLVNKSRLKPFVNAGVGYVRLTFKTKFVGIPYIETPPIKNPLFAVGGGTDVAINKKISLRTGIEYRRIEVGSNSSYFNLNGNRNNGNAYRIHTGIVFHF